MFRILTSSRAKRGDRKILRLLRHFIPRNDGFTQINAFTLAEVLITLLIIGVVSAIVIPSIIQDSQEAEFKTAYKKAYADINQAFLRAKNNYEFVDNNDSIANVVANIRALSNYFNIAKKCTNAVDQGCWTDNCIGGEHDCIWCNYFSETSQAKSEGFIDNAGRQWVHYKLNGYFIMILDTNGDKTPNRMGRDRFPLMFYDENDTLNVKAPTKVKNYSDVSGIWLSLCTFGNCFYTSWLK